MDGVVYVYLVLICFLVVPSTKSQFVNKPEETYAEVSSSVFLDWRYGLGLTVSIRKWSIQRSNEIIPELIVSVQSTGFENVSPRYRDRIEITPNQAGLTIKNLTAKDDGIISCEIVLDNLNTFGDSIELNIFSRHIVTLTSPPTNIVKGKDFTLTCVVESRPISSVVWYKGDEILSNTPTLSKSEVISVNDKSITTVSSKLTIFNATSTDAGNYRCKASHYIGTVAITEKNVTVEILYPPTFFKFPPPTVGIIVGAQNVEFECFVQSFPRSDVTWYIDNVTYQKAVHTRYEVQTIDVSKTDVKSIFRIKQVVLEDLAVYKCMAVNTILSVEQQAEKSLTLVISHKPVFLSKPGDNVMVRQGGNITLNCTVSGYPSPTVWWSTNASLIQQQYVNTTSVKEMPGKTLVYAILIVKDIKPKDYGLFTCTAVQLNQKNETRRMTSTMLKIEYPPSISGLEETTHIEEKTLPFIECKVHSFPSSTIKWFYSKENDTFQDITDRSVEENAPAMIYEASITSKITFPEGILRGNAGHYYCNATNTVGYQVSRSHVIVDWPPIIDAFSGDNSVKLGGTVQFSCIVQSQYTPTVTWLKYNSLITEQPNRTVIRSASNEYFLVISDVQVNDTGNYTCKVESNVANQIRSVVKARQFHVLYIPILTASSSEQNVGLDTPSLTLSCTADAYPPITEYRWVKDGEQLKDISLQNTFTIVTPNPSAQGTYECTPVNPEGAGETVVHKVIIRAQPVFTKPPSCNVTNTSISCECHGIGVNFTAPNVHWTRNGSNVVASNDKFLNVSIGGDTVEAYTCHLNNSDGENSYILELGEIIPEMTEWSSWTECNSTCGDGYTNRSRSRNFLSVNMASTYGEMTCKGINCPVVGTIAEDWHKDWYIAFWVAIPLLGIILIICFLYVKKRNRKREKAIFVPATRVLSTSSTFGTLNGSTRSMDNIPRANFDTRRVSATRDIYLPPQVPLSALKHGYIQEQDTPDLPKKFQTETIEVEIQFQPEEEKAEDAVKHVQENPLHGVINRDYDDSDEEDNFSFPSSTFNHLNSTTTINGPNGAFMSLDNTQNGPPKPPRKMDSTFTDHSASHTGNHFDYGDDDYGDEENVHI